MSIKGLAGAAIGFALLLVVAAGAWGQSVGKPEPRIIPIHPMPRTSRFFMATPRSRGSRSS